jgi:hypothetical protein
MGRKIFEEIFLRKNTDLRNSVSLSRVNPRKSQQGTSQPDCPQRLETCETHQTKTTSHLQEKGPGEGLRGFRQDSAFFTS